MQGGAEDIEEHILSLHAEMCESGEVTSVEEEHDSGNMASRRQRPRGKQHYVVPVPRTNSRHLVKRFLKHQAEVDVEFHDEEDKAAEFKNQVQPSNVEQQIQ